MAGFQNSLAVRHWLTFATGLVECLCFAGAVFGWASLVFVLQREGYFGSLCVNTTANATEVLDCSGQDEQFSLVFTIASFVNNFLSLPNGFIFDHFGTTVARLLGICLYTMGTLMFAFSTSALSILVFPALTLVAGGGILFLITNIQVGNLFGVHRSTVITLYNGAFDSSSGLFFVIKLSYECGVSLRAAFLFISACSVFHVIRTFFLMPKRFIPYPLPEHYTYGISCGKSKSSKVTANSNTPMTEETTTMHDKDAPVKQEKTLRECVLSRFFLFHLLWLSVMQLRHYLFIGTLNPMLQGLSAGDPSLVGQYINAFAITQMCGVLCAPWNGLIIDRHKGKTRAAGESEQESDLRAMVLSLSLTALQCVLFSVCAATPYLPLQYLTFVLQVLNRSFLYGGNAAFLSVAFPGCHFGKLFGLVMALSAVFSLLQYPCFALVKGPLGGDPLYVNIALTMLSLLPFIHPLSVYLHCRRLASQRVKTGAGAAS
ncbi:putative solute carrier family 43 member 3 isoform 4 [Scophthalmus maximus]|uniref:Putative solute carrier family 43 member 3 isoform 4 n=1 Tax=Scophthalmus maximus TaxID=52904 RepID=A0A2U9C7F7_SCOMX|nr:solute carrier family 43 member 3b isoform X1 [Scophthalmus maximus]AWP12050.1 putative solute carrier family 43 member 3 isoform 4 [Scophthalmus maximus]